MKKWEYKLLTSDKPDFDESRKKLASEGWMVADDGIKLPPDNRWAIIMGREIPEPSVHPDSNSPDSHPMSPTEPPTPHAEEEQSLGYPHILYIQ